NTGLGEAWMGAGPANPGTRLLDLVGRQGRTTATSRVACQEPTRQKSPCQRSETTEETARSWLMPSDLSACRSRSHGDLDHNAAVLTSLLRDGVPLFSGFDFCFLDRIHLE